jgi:ComF family protein
MISFFHRLLDLISPRLCEVCGCRLSVTEEVICGSCNLHLPRTGYYKDPYENEMAKLFWGQIPVERATALYFFQPHAETANIIYTMKYKNHPEIGQVMGRMVAREVSRSGFFEGIDAVVPIPLAPKRQRQRGYNQSMEIAQGISEVTGLPVLNKIVRRTSFEGSQTSRGRWERNDNVEHVFELIDAPAANGRHLLIVDDVVTTGATIIACAKELCKVGNVKVSILSLGFAKT